MEPCRQPVGSDEQSMSKQSVSLGFMEPVACSQPIQAKRPQSAPAEVEYDSKSVQLPSLTDGSSRSSSICSEQIVPRSRSLSAASNNIEYISHANNYVAWAPEDENLSHLHRTESPTPLWRSTISRVLQPSASVSMVTVDLPGFQDLVAQHRSELPEALSTASCHVYEHVSGSPCPKNVSSGEPMVMDFLDGRESKQNTLHPAVDSESSDSSSESEDDSDDDDIARGDWSGANDNIEAAIYQSVFPDQELAAYLISNMYSDIVLSSTKKITRKVSSWQEQITTCATDSGTTTGTASTAKEASPKAISSTGNVASLKRDMISSSPDDNIGEDEEDDADESRRKRVKEKSVDNVQEPQEPRLACPFFKKDPSKYSVQKSKHYRACGGPGWLTIPQLKEHLKRVHYPVQCERCYLIFEFKRGQRSPAVSKLAEHRQQEERCPRQADSLKEGISDAEWSRLSEEKKSRKGKAAIPEKPQSAVDKWKEIWIILFPTAEVPQTPWYDAPLLDAIPPSPSQGLNHFLEISEKVIDFKLPAIKDARSDEHLKTLLLDVAQKTFQTWYSTPSSAADTTTDSFSNNDGSGPFGTGTSGSRQRVANPPAPPPLEDLSPRTTTTHLFPYLNPSTQNNHTGTANTPTPLEVNMEGVNMDGAPRNMSTNSAAYSMPVPGNFPLNAAIAGQYPVMGQATCQNTSAGASVAAWAPGVENMQFNDSLDMSRFSPVIPNMGDQWQYSATNFSQFDGAS
ncbi:hypothetical protein BDZ45DRAFT_51012 [Acephala macrosclerotiorum]|nr:hypothetical protein BDZ45DRAFT_51012 [Acephala macrosclerotiorum]